MTKGTPVRRNSEDFELPATLIGATPYLLAAKFLEVDIMRALAAGGADTRLPMKTGETPLMAAAGMGASPQTDRRGLSILDGGKIEPEPLVAAAVSAALEQGADVNAANQNGDTALHARRAARLRQRHHAAREGRREDGHEERARPDGPRSD